MKEHKRDKIQKQKKVQSIYRKKKQRRGDMDDMEEMYDKPNMLDKDELNNMDDNKIAVVIVNICAVLGLLVYLILYAFRPLWER